MSVGDNPHLLLGRIRFLNKCIESFRSSEPVPDCLCYVPKEVCYKICKDSSPTSAASGASAGGSAVGKPFVSVFESPNQSPHSKRLWRCNIEPKKGNCIRTTGEEYCNNQGLWVKISKEQLEEYHPGQELEEGWILACKHSEGGDRLVPLESPATISRQQQLFGFDHRPCNSWEQVVDVVENGFYHITNPKIADCDEAAVQKLRYVPPTWTYECDEDLVRFFHDHEQREDGGLDPDKEVLGCLFTCVRRIDLSSLSVNCDGVTGLTDDCPDSYWESRGKKGQHWIRLHMKKSILINKLMLILDPEDDNFIPKRVIVHGGGRKHLRKLNEVTIDDVTAEVCVLEDRTDHLPVIEIRIEECRGDGEDVRIRGLKIESSLGRDLGVNADIFQSSNLVRFPRLSGTPPDILYHRAKVIQRLVSLLDSVLPHVVPAWEHSLGTFNQIASMKQFFLLSKCRFDLITQCLNDSETKTPKLTPTLSINRRLAAEHRDNPSLDPRCKNTVFTQIYEGLKPSEKTDRNLDYRWPSTHNQWWECKFIGEGIIDGGGGFRDSLTDMSEELCPSSAECPIPLPFFIRTPNQDASEARDYYVPNPSCKEFHKYEWIGHLMGAALRGKDLLVLALPGMVWKQLTGEAISWSKDFPAVDSVLVNLLEGMENMDQEAFEFRFGEELVYTTLLTDGQMVELIPDGSNIPVRYEDRSEFIRLVQKARLEESKQQIAAMRAGLLNVVPQAVLELFTWQEVQKKVCGDPEITVEALKQSTRFGMLEQNDIRVKYLWEALTNFTNEDRSRFLRFVTGRSRLPAPFMVFFDNPSSEKSDDLPTSSTCSSTVNLPSYSSAKACEEKLRYAAYNCVAIDNDLSPWED